MALERDGDLRLIGMILQLEADGAYYTCAEIDRYLEAAAADLGYSHEDVSRLKALMADERYHEVLGKTAHWQGGTRRECNIYRITPRGIAALRGKFQI